MRKLTFILLLALSTNLISQQLRKSRLNWQLEYKNPGNENLQIAEAKVPGAIQLDIAKAEGYGPYYFADNWKDYVWMEDVSFTYKAEFRKPKLAGNEQYYFISKGIDYSFEILFNEDTLWKQEGMFTPVKLNLTDFLEEDNILKIRIFPIPKTHHLNADRSQASQSVKPAVSYGWDWHPRLVPSGIWDETYLAVLPVSHLCDSYLEYSLNEDLNTAWIHLNVEGENLKGNRLAWQLSDSTGKIISEQSIVAASDAISITDSLKNPHLWWTHDHGVPYRYSSRIILKDSEGEIIDALTEKVGFRRVRLVMNTGAWSSPVGFPKSRSVAPAQFELNGRRIFAKGTNWVNPEIFPGIITKERYNELTDRVLEANFNMLRIWGGGIINKEFFYEQCDEKGILVWQEFPLACNNYVGTPGYLMILDQEATSIIKRLRKHACIGIWSGGNELFNSWSGMTDQSLALRLLNSKCLELDPHTPYINTSPLYGMGHGHYVFRDMDSDEEVYSTMKRAKFTAYTEFGIPSPSSVEILNTIIPEAERWPPKPGTSWEDHHAYNAWGAETWLMQGMIEDYFGKSKNLEELVKNGQAIQNEGYKAIFEEARRQKPYCAMALNWCFNEPWPTAANNSIINWPNHAKPAFYAVSAACRPVLVSARIQKFKWNEGEIFETDLYMLNDTFDKIDPGTVLVKLVSGDKVIKILNWEFGEIDSNKNLAGPTARINLPKWSSDRFKLVLEVNGHPEYNSEYLLLYKPKNQFRRGPAQ